MGYDVILFVIVLAIPLVVGLALIADAVRRAIREARETNHDLHA